MRWTDDLWRRVVANAESLLASDGKLTKTDALMKAQRLVVPREHRRTKLQLRKHTFPSTGTYDAAVKQLQALSSADVAAMLVGPARKAAAPEQKAHGSRWTSRERALAARAVEKLQADPANAAKSLADLYIVAQTTVDVRQRSAGGIKQAGYAGLLTKQHKAALADAWKYEPAAVPPAAPPATPAEAPAAPPPTVAEGFTFVEPGRRLSDAGVAFAQSMSAAIDALLAAHQATMSERFEQQLAGSVAAIASRMGPLVQDLLQTQVRQISDQVEQGLRKVLLEELGGASSSAPAVAPAAPAPAPAAPAAAPPAGPVLKIDVLGIIEPEWRARIEDAARGHDLRIVHPDHMQQFAPHKGRFLIVMQQTRFSRSLQKKLQTTGVKPMVVRDAGGQVLRAVQDITGSVTLQ